MDTTTIILFIITIGSGFYMAWSIGANDVANAMGTSVGSGALTIKKAVIIAAILEFSGAFFVGSSVTNTIRKGIIDPAVFSHHEMHLVYGMIGALLAAAIWLQIASHFGWPVSTTHSIVGAVLGFGLVFAGINAINWVKIISIVASWVTSPLIAGITAFIIFTIIRRVIYFSDNPVRATKKFTPYIVFIVFLVLTLVMVFKGLKNLHLNLTFSMALLVAASVGLIAAVVSHLLVRNVKEDISDDTNKKEEEILCKQPEIVANNVLHAVSDLKKAIAKSDGQIKRELQNLLDDLDTINSNLQRHTTLRAETAEYKTVEKIFVYLQILSASFVAFAHGANDVANAIGPVAAVVSILKNGHIMAKSPVPLWILAMGGVGIVIGLATWGWKVMITIGKKITELTPTRGFSAEFAAAITIVFASKLGIPISTTHTLVGGVLGVGFARGLNALNMQVIRNIIISWLITIPIGAIGTIILYYILLAIFGA